MQEKGVKTMPKGEGTYGSQVGRPPKDGSKRSKKTYAGGGETGYNVYKQGGEIPENIKKQLEYSGSDEHKEEFHNSPFAPYHDDIDKVYKEIQREEYEEKYPVLSGKKTLQEVTAESVEKSKRRVKEGIKKQKRLTRDFEYHVDEAKSGEYPYQRAYEEMNTTGTEKDRKRYQKHKLKKVADSIAWKKEQQAKNTEYADTPSGQDWSEKTSEYDRAKTDYEKDERKYKKGGKTAKKRIKEGIKKQKDIQRELEGQHWEATQMQKRYSEYDRPKTTTESKKSSPGYLNKPKENPQKDYYDKLSPSMKKIYLKQRKALKHSKKYKSATEFYNEQKRLKDKKK